MNEELMTKVIDDLMTVKNGITVITGPNGSGKTYFLNKVKAKVEEKNLDFIVLDFDSHAHLDEIDLKKFAEELKIKAVKTHVIIVSLSKTIIETADRLIDTQENIN